MTPHQDVLSADLGRMPLPDAAIEVGIDEHLVVVVEGTPVQQGSKKSLGPGRPWVDDNATTLKPWRALVANSAREAMTEMHPDGDRPLFPRGTAVEIEITFTLKRPGSHYGSGRNANALKPNAPDRHVGTPDADKLVRAIFDSLTDAGVWEDDKQACEETGRRVYTRGHRPHRDALKIPGAVIRIKAVAP